MKMIKAFLALTMLALVISAASCSKQADGCLQCLVTTYLPDGKVAHVANSEDCFMPEGYTMTSQNGENTVTTICK